MHYIKTQLIDWVAESFAESSDEPLFLVTFLSDLVVQS